MQIDENLVIHDGRGESVSLEQLITQLVKSHGDDWRSTDKIAEKLSVELDVIRSELWLYRFPFQ